MVTLWICSIFSVKAQTTIYEHGAEITSIDQIKDGTPFVMKKGSEYLCFPEAQNASMKEIIDTPPQCVLLQTGNTRINR